MRSGEERAVSIPATPEVQLLGGEVAALHGLAALDVYRLMTEGIAVVRRRDGIEPSPRLMQTVAVLKASAMAARGSDIADIADVRKASTSPVLRSGERVGVEEVARMCGVGHRQARRLAPSLGGIKTRKGWVFDPALVQSYLDTEKTR